MTAQDNDRAESPSPAAADRPFRVAALGCAAAAALGIGWLFTAGAQGQGEAVRVAVLAAAAALILGAAWFHVWPASSRLLTAPLSELPCALQEARQQLTDLVAIRREYHKVRTDLEGYAQQATQAIATLQEALRQGLAGLEARQQAFDRAALDLKKADAEKMELRQAKGSADRKAEQWQKAAVQFARMLERLTDPESGVAEAYGKAARKLTEDFARAFGPLGLQLIRPAPGDLFHDLSHAYAGEVETADHPPGHVAACRAWGFVIGDAVVSRAQVVVAKAPRPAPRPEPAAAAPAPQE